MSISNYAENKILDAVFNAAAFSVATPYVSLHTADPGETGASEVSGGAGPYARQTGSFGAAAGGALSNDGQLDFVGMPGVTITHVGIWDAPTAGNFIWGGPLGASKVVNAGDTVTIPIGDLDVNLD